MIISVGYRINSLRGTHFRIWATQVLREFLMKGFTIDDERLKRGGEVAKNYLTSNEINTLNRIVSLYLDFADLQALDKRPMYMKDWLNKLDDFLIVCPSSILMPCDKRSSYDLNLVNSYTQ